MPGVPRRPITSSRVSYGLPATARSSSPGLQETYTGRDAWVGGVVRAAHTANNAFPGRRKHAHRDGRSSGSEA